MLNILTIDVEDYFQVSAFEGCVSRENWDNYPVRVEANTVRILDILDEFGVTATFFVLGWVAERKPSLVKEITRRGHEVASHGYGHQRVCTQTRQEFRDDVRRSKAILEDLVAAKVHGYRAPSYSISMDTLWAYDELLEADYAYDSSVFPIRHDLYGISDWPRHPFTVKKGNDGRWQPVLPDARCPNHSDVGSYSLGHQSLVVESLSVDQESAVPCSLTEIPITTLKLGGKSIPIGGGGYFRFFPYSFTRWGLRRINRVDKRPFVFYLHPWEIDPGQPRMTGTGLKTRFRHYVNLARTEQRFRSLLSDFKFAPMRTLVEALTA